MGEVSPTVTKTGQSISSTALLFSSSPNGRRRAIQLTSCLGFKAHSTLAPVPIRCLGIYNNFPIALRKTELRKIICMLHSQSLRRRHRRSRSNALIHERNRYIYGAYCIRSRHNNCTYWTGSGHASPVGRKRNPMPSPPEPPSLQRKPNGKWANNKRDRNGRPV